MVNSQEAWAARLGFPSENRWRYSGILIVLGDRRGFRPRVCRGRKVGSARLGDEHLGKVGGVGLFLDVEMAGTETGLGVSGKAPAAATGRTAVGTASGGGCS
jgi:hypothetical protein